MLSLRRRGEKRRRRAPVRGDKGERGGRGIKGEDLGQLPYVDSEGEKKKRRKNCALICRRKHLKKGRGTLLGCPGGKRPPSEFVWPTARGGKKEKKKQWSISLNNTKKRGFLVWVDDRGKKRGGEDDL